MVLVKGVMVFVVELDTVESLVDYVAVAVVLAAAEFAVVRAELQAEVRVETRDVEKVVVSVELDFAEVMAVAGVVVYVGSVAAVIVAVVGLLENCIVAAVEGLARAAVTAEIGAAANDVGIGVDVVV